MVLSDFADTMGMSEKELLNTLNFDISKLPTPKIPQNISKNVTLVGNLDLKNTQP